MPTATELRSGVASLATLASADLAALWRMVDSPGAAIEPLRDVLPGLIDTYGLAASSLAADWYDDAREEVGARGRFRAIPADIAETGAQALIGWAASEARDATSLRTLVEGGTQRRIANFSRLTVSRSSIADPAANGWKRTGVGECEFCRMLIGRGAVYTEATADFQSHDHCNCGAAPSWA